MYDGKTIIMFSFREMLRLQHFYNKSQVVGCYWIEFETKTKITFLHGFLNRTGPEGRTVKTGNRDENRFFKPKEPDFLLIP